MLQIPLYTRADELHQILITKEDGYVEVPTSRSSCRLDLDLLALLADGTTTSSRVTAAPPLNLILKSEKLASM